MAKQSRCEVWNQLVFFFFETILVFAFFLLLSTRLHAFVLLRLVGFTPGRTLHVKVFAQEENVFYAELNEFSVIILAEDGHAGVGVRENSIRPEIIIRATRTRGVFGEKGTQIRVLTSVVQRRFGFPETSVEFFFFGPCKLRDAQSESVRYKLLGGIAVRPACHSVVRLSMKDDTEGCEVVMSAKFARPARQHHEF